MGKSGHGDRTETIIRDRAFPVFVKRGIEVVKRGCLCHTTPQKNRGGSPRGRVVTHGFAKSESNLRRTVRALPRKGQPNFSAVGRHAPALFVLVSRICRCHRKVDIIRDVAWLSIRERHMWEQFADELTPCLDTDDDVSLWEVAVDLISRDVVRAVSAARSPIEIRLCIGRSLEWTHRTQTRWATEGPRWSSGFGGAQKYRHRRPPLEWSTSWLKTDKRFELTTSDPPTDGATVIIAMPPGTMLHQQAAVYANWTPRIPQKRNKAAIQLYGFDKKEAGWQLSARFCSDDSL